MKSLYYKCISAPLIIVLEIVVSYRYFNKFQKLINRPEMNCSMSIPPYHYFSNNILFDFPSSGINML
jgi:hypothetical protein